MPTARPRTKKGRSQENLGSADPSRPTQDEEGTRTRGPTKAFTSSPEKVDIKKTLASQRKQEKETKSIA